MRSTAPRGRRLRRVPARQLLLADNVVRGVFLGAVAVAWLAALLSPQLNVALLAVSSLLHVWAARAGYTLLAEARHRVRGYRTTDPQLSGRLRRELDGEPRHGHEAHPGPRGTRPRTEHQSPERRVAEDGR